MITGKLIEIFETNPVSATFRKREFVIEVVDGTYSETIKLEMIQDKCELLDAFQIGMAVNVEYNLKGRPWIDPKTQVVKYFNTIQAWKIEAQNDYPQPTQQAPAATPPPTGTYTNEHQDDVDF